MDEKSYLKRSGKHILKFIPSYAYQAVSETFSRVIISDPIHQDDDTAIMSLRPIHNLIEEEPYFFPAFSYLTHAYMDLGEARLAAEVMEIGYRSFQALLPTDFQKEKDRMPWKYIPNRDVLSFLFEHAMLQDRFGGWMKGYPYFQEVYDLDPEDNQSVRAVLCIINLKAHFPEKVLEITRTDYEEQMPLLLGRALAYMMLSNHRDAHRILLPHAVRLRPVLKEFLAAYHFQPSSIDPLRIRKNSKEEAFILWEGMGNLWQSTPGAMDLLADIK